MMRPTRANKPDGYLLGSYCVATAPEPNSRRLTSLKSIHFDSLANKIGPWPASLGCTTNSYSSINPSSANAFGSVTPATNSPLPDSPLNGLPQLAVHEFRVPIDPVQGARHDVLFRRVDDRPRAKGSIQTAIQSGLTPVRARGRHAASSIS
jgi:hypothetical protein